VKCAAAADSLRLHIDGTVDVSLVTNCDCILCCLLLSIYNALCTSLVDRLVQLLLLLLAYLLD